MALFQEEDVDCYRFRVRPNSALSWRWTKRLILLFAGCMAAVSWYFASLGAWLVLPFAGLELAVLAAGFYLCALAGKTSEVVEIREDGLRLLRGASSLQEIASMPRHWTRVLLVRDPRGWHPSRLFLRCHGRSVEIRTRLVESEREELAYALERALGCELCTDAGSLRQGASVRVPTGYCEGDAHAMTRVRSTVDGNETTTGANGAQL